MNEEARSVAFERGIWGDEKKDLCDFIEKFAFVSDDMNELVAWLNGYAAISKSRKHYKVGKGFKER